MAAITLPTDPLSTKFPDLGSVVSKALPYVYVLAGLSMLVVLIMGGITLMTAAGNPGKSKQGYGMIQAGLVGFFIIFIAYFVVQLAEVILGVKIF
jgi:phosphate starvation-inducible membrane PsiE